jgi:hypothetical protein
VASCLHVFQKPSESHVQYLLILLPRDRNRTRRGSKTRVRDLHECAYPSLKEYRSDRSTRLIGARTRIHTAHLGCFAEDGEESSVVVLGSAKRRPKWQGLDRLHLCQHMVGCRCRGLIEGCRIVSNYRRERVLLSKIENRLYWQEDVEASEAFILLCEACSCGGIPNSASLTKTCQSRHLYVNVYQIKYCLEHIDLNFAH